MRPEYFDGVKFYITNDLSFGGNLDLAISKLKELDLDKKFDDINEIIELYNIQLVLRFLDDEYKEKIQFDIKEKKIKTIIGKFFNKICDDNFFIVEKQVSNMYYDDFWILFCKYKIYKKISNKVFYVFLCDENTILSYIIKHKEIVQYYDDIMGKILRVSEQTTPILARKFLEKNKENYYLPKSLEKEEYEAIFQRYIDSDNANINILQLIFQAQSSKECPISDKLKLRAQKVYNDFWKMNTGVSLEQAVEIHFKDQEKIKDVKREGMKFKISYDKKWLEANLDYATILNNFTYLFEMFDANGRSTLVSIKSQISALERAFSIKGRKFYETGVAFRTSEMLSLAQMSMYYDFLKSKNIFLEDIFKWFFESYIKDEFGVKDFLFNLSSKDSTYVEKCRNLASEMEGILKQFRMYVKDRHIDRDLYEMSSEHMIISDIPSLIKNKYGYAKNKEVENMMYLLFSDQSGLGYTEKAKSKYKTLVQLLIHENMSIEDFNECHKGEIEWLEKNKCVLIENDNTIKLYQPKVYLLKQLYDKEVLCLQYLEDLKEDIATMVKLNQLVVYDSLFCKPEIKYMNYVLNKSEYSNGLDLRNKYMHSTYSRDEDVQRQDYMKLLIVMLIVINKINEEFCILDSKIDK